VATTLGQLAIWAFAELWGEWGVLVFSGQKAGRRQSESAAAHANSANSPLALFFSFS